MTRPKRPKMGELVRCEIDDTTSLGGEAGAWILPEEIAGRATSPIEAVGWVVHKDARFLSLAGLRDMSPDVESIGNVIRLPWGSVMKIDTLGRRR